MSIISFSRRHLLATAAGILCLPALNVLAGSEDDFAVLERDHGGRLGVSVLDTGSGETFGHRDAERFPMCSTFKLPLVAAVLARVDAGKESLERRIAYGPADLLEYAPVTRQHVGEGAMTVSALCAAAITYSDNTAANLLLKTIDGPGGWTAWVRTIGDSLSRLDRNEPSLNTALPGDPRDTTTPAAMLHNLQSLLLGKVLTEASQQRLIDWLKANTTGAAKLRAGLPSSRAVGDKTGSGANGATNDVAIVWPPQRKPLLIVTYYVGSTASQDARNEVLEKVGRIVAARFTSK